MANRKETLLKVMDSRARKKLTAVDIDNYHSLEMEKEADITQVRAGK